MNAEEINEMMKWFAENFAKLDFTEQMQIGMVVSECVNKIKPIYLKYVSFDDKTTFLFKM